MDNTQVFVVLFLQNVLNFFTFYFFMNKYSRVVNDLNIHFEKTTRLFLEHLTDMYEYGTDYWNRCRYCNDDDYDTNEKDEQEEDEVEDEETGKEVEVEQEEETDEEVENEDEEGSFEVEQNPQVTSCEESFAQNCI